MLRSAVLLLALAAFPAAAQTTVGASVSVAPLAGGYAGEPAFIDPTATVVELDASHPLGRVAGADLAVEAALSAASTDFFGEGDAAPLALRAADLGAVVSAATPGDGRAHARLGVVLDLGPDLFDGDGGDALSASASTDGGHALRLGAGLRQPAGRSALWFGADAFLTPVRRTSIPYTDIENPVSDSTLTTRFHPGHTLVLRGGASRTVGPVTLGAELVSAVRTDNLYEIIGSPIPRARSIGPSVVSVVPSVVWQREGVSIEAAVRAPGLILDEHLETGVPLVVNVARVARWPLSLRLAYAL